MPNAFGLFNLGNALTGYSQGQQQGIDQQIARQMQLAKLKQMQAKQPLGQPFRGDDGKAYMYYQDPSSGSITAQPMTNPDGSPFQLPDPIAEKSRQRQEDLESLLATARKELGDQFTPDMQTAITANQLGLPYESLQKVVNMQGTVDADVARSMGATLPDGSSIPANMSGPMQVAYQTSGFKRRIIATQAKESPTGLKAKIDETESALGRKLTPDEVLRLSGTESKTEPRQTFEEQEYDEWLKKHPGGTRLQFEQERKASERPPDQGSFIPMYDPKNPGVLTGAWNPKSNIIRPAPAGAGTTAQGINQQKAASAVLDKKVKPLQDILDSAAQAKDDVTQAAAGNPSADVDLAIEFFKVMRSGASNIRFTKQEQELIFGTRSAFEALQAAAQKAVNGAPLAPKQRQDLLRVIESHAKKAQQQKQQLTQQPNVPPPSGVPLTSDQFKKKYLNQ